MPQAVQGVQQSVPAPWSPGQQSARRDADRSVFPAEAQQQDWPAPPRGKNGPPSRNAITRRWPTWPRAAALAQRRAENQRLGGDEPELNFCGWRLQEFRVLLFAQQLSTALPVSAKRLDQHSNELRR